MRAMRQIILTFLISLSLVFSGGASAQAQDWQDKKQREHPKEKEKDRDERKKDEKKDEKKDDGKKKPF